MARGRRKSTTKKVVETTADAVSSDLIASEPVQESVQEAPSVSSVYIGKIDPVVEPVPNDITVEQIEPVIEDEIPVPDSEEPSTEPVNTIKGLPDPVKPLEIVRPPRNKKIDEPKHEIVPNDTTVTKVKDTNDKVPLYPQNVSPIIQKLRAIPAYRYLPYETLVKIAAAKLRSRYFFNNMKTGSVKANFNIR